MNCEILNTLYIKSNGEVLCNDDRGEAVVLGALDEADLDVAKLLWNERFTHLRSTLGRGEVPWPGICDGCAFLRRDERSFDGLKERRIAKLQVEPSLACNLACPACNNSSQLRTRSKPHFMKLELFEAVLLQLKEAGYSVDWIEYCGQGEPLMHPKFAAFVRTCRKILPQCKQRLITNGNFDYWEKVEGEFVEEILVSCDGVLAASYEKYRIRGEVELPLKFIADVPKDRRERLVWKYILLEFNDSDAELIEAQKIASRLGVESLLFVVTHSDYRSERFTLSTLGQLPIIHSVASTNAHPRFYEGARIGRPLNTRSPLRRLKALRYDLHLDEAYSFPPNILFLRGWVAARKQIDSVKIACNGQTLGVASLVESREDVIRALPRYSVARGFRFSGVLPNGESDELRVSFSLLNSGRTVGQIEEKLTFES